MRLRSTSPMKRIYGGLEPTQVAQAMQDDNLVRATSPQRIDAEYFPVDPASFDAAAGADSAKTAGRSELSTRDDIPSFNRKKAFGLVKKQPMHLLGYQGRSRSHFNHFEEQTDPITHRHWAPEDVPQRRRARRGGYPNDYAKNNWTWGEWSKKWDMPEALHADGMPAREAVSGAGERIYLIHGFQDLRPAGTKLGGPDRMPSRAAIAMNDRRELSAVDYHVEMEQRAEGEGYMSSRARMHPAKESHNMWDVLPHSANLENGTAQELPREKPKKGRAGEHTMSERIWDCMNHDYYFNLHRKENQRSPSDFSSPTRSTMSGGTGNRRSGYNASEMSEETASMASSATFAASGGGLRRGNSAAARGSATSRDSYGSRGQQHRRVGTPGGQRPRTSRSSGRPGGGGGGGAPPRGSGVRSSSAGTASGRRVSSASNHLLHSGRG